MWKRVGGRPRRRDPLARPGFFDGAGSCAPSTWSLSLHGTGCGADKSTESLTITTPAGEREFFDDFYACLATPGRTYIANIDAVFTALYALAM